MKLTIISSDKVIIKDGESVFVDFAIAENVHAIQWNGEFGIIEYKVGEPSRFTDESIVAPYLALHAEATKTVEPAPPTQTESIADYERTLDSHLDSVAQTHRFKDRHSLALRAAYPNSWQPLATAFAVWMDNCNVLAYQTLQDVLDGKREIPTKEEFISSLPIFSYQ